MNRTTIDIGIDLGTTNSAIAVLEGVQPKIIQNEGAEYTPSAVMITKNNRIYVGRDAKNTFEVYDGDTYCEFKRNMGTDYVYKFAASGRQMKPEELSAEVLKTLRSAAILKLGNDIKSAVITVPAAFELPQCEATQHAAKMAGFEVSPLLQEPIAAAMAHGFQSNNDKVYWLIYDFGGGTFDAAVINMRDGILRVVNHGGDNHLGGKNVDEKIVDELLVPVFQRERNLENFNRSNQTWRREFGLMKREAEKSKIKLSLIQEDSIPFADIFENEESDANITISQNEVARLAAPFIHRSISICRDVLSQARLSTNDIEQLILVGGPTQAPYFREILRDPVEGLGIPLETKVDPFTVVAQGAAIFAGTQRLDTKIFPAVSPGQFRIELEYQPIGIDDQPVVGGKVVPPDGTDISSYTIEFSRPQWRSGRIQLASTGTFLITLQADKGVRNIFKITLHNQQGSILEIIPDELSYTIGNTPANPPLIHSMGVALANNDAIIFFQKGISLPARRKEFLRTAIGIKRGDTGAMIKIPVIEGENQRADRNFCVGSLDIKADNIRRDVPLGSEIEVTLDIDENRLIKTKAYLPILDEEYEKVIDLKIITPVNFDEMANDFIREKDRFVDLKEQIEQSGNPHAQQILLEIQDQQRVQELERLLSAARGEADSAHEARRRLIELKALLDQLETFIEWPALVEEAREEIERAGNVVSEWGNEAAKKKMAELETEINQAILSKDSDILRKKIEDMADFRYSILWTRPEFHIYFFQSFEKDLYLMRNREQAINLLAEGRRAIQDEDLNRLIRVNQQLYRLLPEDEARKITQGFGSTVIR